MGYYRMQGAAYRAGGARVEFAGYNRRAPGEPAYAAHWTVRARVPEKMTPALCHELVKSYERRRDGAALAPKHDWSCIERARGVWDVAVIYYARD